MIKIINDDIFNTSCNIIAHQVNNCGVMGIGLAAQIRKKFPKVYTRYIRLHKSLVFNKHDILLGQADLIQVGENKYIANMYSQDMYGHDKSVVYTDYELFEKCIKYLYRICKKNKLSLAMPYYIGCGYGNGDWDKIEKIIYKYFNDDDLECILYNISHKK